MHSPAKLKRERYRAGLTPRQLAEKAGCTKTYINALERGQYTPSAPVLMAIASALGVDIDALLQDDAPDAAAPVAEAKP